MLMTRVRRTASRLPPPHKPQGVLVEVDGDNGRPLSCSGLRWGRLVLTHGSLLPPGKAPAAPGGRLAPTGSPDLRSRIVGEDGRLGGRVVAAWRCPLLDATAAELASKGWNFPNADLALFLVIQVDDPFQPDLTLDEVRAELQTLLSEWVTAPVTGQAVLLEATPFGAGHFFLNTWTKGIINKVTGQGQSIILCDSHAAPGSEGGALYSVGTEGRKVLLGLVVQTIFKVRGEAVSLCMAASLQTVLSTALGILTENITKPLPSDSPEVASRGVALLRHGGAWASAVALDSAKGIYLTCAHVLQADSKNSVLLQWTNGSGPVAASILYLSPSSSAFDVALLKTAAAPGPKVAPKISRRLPTKGEIVEVIGYGLLSPPGPEKTLHGPLVSRGCISQVWPHMLQTSCAVHCGNSGGAVLQGQELVGLVVGHTEVTYTDPELPKNWPRINFAVPLAAIANPIERFLKTGDEKYLDALGNFDKEATRLWQLNPIPKSKL
ncbi:peroxisomal leader peptide-processing protease-like [Neocloeon triangulifer]|uniref:peroxisomal leader peptide-processing protease-like n=1 Tax=Neocloeon triangulifer TaxID=2078957 RepID=UPI00286EC104|nr:peroxisomal leader peptide-processing protease-like [Neocloeon triangulifer]